MKVSPETSCPCGSRKEYQHCCLRFHNQSCVPATAEELMRSRYSAFCTGELSYLINSWHPAFRPAAETILSDCAHYISLQIIDTDKGRPEDTTGEVTFVVQYIDNDQLVTMKEKSSFIKHQHKWLYQEGENELSQKTLKKSAPCPCGSGKKFKRCCFPSR